MNTTTKAEQTALTLPKRAAVALGESANEAKLRALAAQSAGIITVTNTDGRDEAHRAAMVLRTTRTNITNTGKAAREDATAFSKAVIAKEKELIAIIEPEEVRILALRDAFDEMVAAEKAARIAAERARVDAIQKAVQALRDMPLQAVGKTSAEISAIISGMVGAEPGESFEEFLDEAKLARLEALDKLAAAETAQRAVEIEAEGRRQAEARAAAEAEEARLAEAARVAAEKVELARQRAENERIAADQAAEAKRLAEAAAAQAAAAKAAQKAADDAAAAERAKQAQAAAETQAKLDAQAASLAEQQRKLAEQQAAADARDAAAQAAREQAELDRIAQEEIDQNPPAASEAAIEQMSAPVILNPAADWPAPAAPAQAALVELADEQLDDALFPTDGELVTEIRAMLAETFGMSLGDADARMTQFDYARALAEIGK